MTVQEKLNAQIDKDELAAFAELVDALPNYSGTLTLMYHGCRFDVLAEDKNGHRTVIELKNRPHARWNKFPSIIALSVEKFNALKEIQDKKGYRVVWVQLYPRSGKYIAMDLQQIQEHGWIDRTYKHKVEDDPNSPMIWVEEWHVAPDEAYFTDYHSTWGERYNNEMEILVEQ